MTNSILEIENLHVHFPIHNGTVRAVDNVTLSLNQGEVMGLVGESGCGKSTLGFSILKLLRPPGIIAKGQIRYHGDNIAKMSDRELLGIRGKRIAMIFQDPLTYLNPLFRIGDQVVDPAYQQKTPMKGPARCSGVWGSRRTDCSNIPIRCPGACAKES